MAGAVIGMTPEQERKLMAAAERQQEFLTGQKWKAVRVISPSGFIFDPRNQVVLLRMAAQ